jgi:hypothetical protein
MRRGAKRVADYKECDIRLVGSSQYLIAAGLNQFPVCFNNGTSIERFLLMHQFIL